MLLHNCLGNAHLLRFLWLDPIHMLNLSFLLSRLRKLQLISFLCLAAYYRGLHLQCRLVLIFISLSAEALSYLFSCLLTPCPASTLVDDGVYRLLLTCIESHMHAGSHYLPIPCLAPYFRGFHALCRLVLIYFYQLGYSIWSFPASWPLV